MKRVQLLFLTLCMLTGTIKAQVPLVSDSETTLNKDTLNYWMGYYLGKDIENQLSGMFEEEYNPDLVIQGISDALYSNVYLNVQAIEAVIMKYLGYEEYDEYDSMEELPPFSIPVEPPVLSEMNKVDDNLYYEITNEGEGELYDTSSSVKLRYCVLSWSGNMLEDRSDTYNIVLLEFLKPPFVDVILPHARKGLTCTIAYRPDPSEELYEETDSDNPFVLLYIELGEEIYE